MQILMSALSQTMREESLVKWHVRERVGISSDCIPAGLVLDRTNDEAIAAVNAAAYRS